MKISFHCVTPAKVGGCTPVFDTREVLKHIDPEVVEKFRTKGLMYVRNFSRGVDPTWEEFFHTTDRAKVEQMCRDAGSDFEWKSDGGLRVINRTKGVVKHPKTKDDTFFNQVQIHHIYCVDEDTREGLRALFDEQDLPRNVYYGDASRPELLHAAGCEHAKLFVPKPAPAALSSSTSTTTRRSPRDSASRRRRTSRRRSRPSSTT